VTRAHTAAAAMRVHARAAMTAAAPARAPTSFLTHRLLRAPAGVARLQERLPAARAGHHRGRLARRAPLRA
jgi:hypothetical protein